jgi:hypothetical protein
MQRLIPAMFLLGLLTVCVSGCGPTYGYGGGYPAFGYAPYWGGFVRPEPRFALHHPWEDHWHGRAVGFYHGPAEYLANAEHFAGFHGGGFRGGGGHR